MLLHESEGAYRVCEKCKTYVFVKGVILDFGDQDYDIEPTDTLPKVCEICETEFTGDTESWIFRKVPEDLGYRPAWSEPEEPPPQTFHGSGNRAPDPWKVKRPKFTPKNIIKWG